MASETRKVDEIGCVTSSHDVADPFVIVKRMSDDKAHVIKIKGSRTKYSLAEMLKQITPESLHDEVDTGSPVGAEDW